MVAMRSCRDWYHPVEQGLLRESLGSRGESIGEERCEN